MNLAAQYIPTVSPSSYSPSLHVPTPYAINNTPPISQVKETVSACLAETGADKVVLVGHSAGGWLARAALADGQWEDGVASEDVVAGEFWRLAILWPRPAFLHFFVIPFVYLTNLLSFFVVLDVSAFRFFLLLLCSAFVAGCARSRCYYSTIQFITPTVVVFCALMAVPGVMDVSCQLFVRPN